MDSSRKEASGFMVFWDMSRPLRIDARFMTLALELARRAGAKLEIG